MIEVLGGFVIMNQPSTTPVVINDDFEYVYDTPATHTDMKCLSVGEVETILADEPPAPEVIQEEVATEQVPQEQYETSYYGSSGGGSRELRIWNESRGDYGAYDGTYAGAYQFAVEYLEGRMAAAGLEYNGVDDFLNSPDKQDALADWYAQERYQGWENTPTVGGW